jgi:small subunit ribosomal protein S14
VKQRRLRALRVASKLPFRSRYYNRCGRCGRARGYYRKFDLCRICMRLLALEGKIPGMTKSSW